MSRVVKAGDFIIYKGKPYEVKRAFGNVNASTTGGAVVAAVAGQKIRVVALVTMAGGTATTITFLSNSNAISPLFAQGINLGVNLDLNEFGWFETAAGEAINATTGTGSATGYIVLYIEVP